MKKNLILIAIISMSTNLFAQTAPVYTSLTIGTNTIASGTNAFAAGMHTQAIGVNAIAHGAETKAVGNNSTALGENNTASGNKSFVAGVLNTASGENSIVLGTNCIASGSSSIAIGSFMNTNNKSNSIAIGDYPYENVQLNNDADNQMLMRFRGGYKFHINRSKIAFAINPDGTVAIDPGNTNNGSLVSGLIFGNASGEGIASKRGAGGNQYGLDFYSNFANRMSITNGGNIGIGTSVPAAKFSLSTTGEDLGGTVPSKVFKTYSGVLGTNAGAEIKLASFGFKSGNWTSLGISAYRYIGNDGWPNAAIVFGYDVDNTPGAGSYFALAGNGNFGIGTAAPGAKLHVMGNIIATGSITPSDIRYKKDIHPLKGALKKIMSLSGYSYSFRTNEFPNMQFDSKQQVGLIAQEVENVLPQVVYTTQDGYKGVDYAKVVPLLIEGMKEQQQQIDELKKLVAELIKNK
ncbi:MAG: tail fiber domain-containing protein [Bacteroidota bacterium]